MTIEDADEQTRQVVRHLLSQREAQRALARRLGVSRETLLAIACGARVSRGSLALVRERIRAFGGALDGSSTPPEAA